MGNCAKCVGHRQETEHIIYDNYDQQPDDTQMLKNVDFPQLTLHGLLRKFKLKMINPSELYSIKLTIDDIEQLLLHEKHSDDQGQIKWEIEEKFTLKCNQYELRKKFLHIDVINSSKEVVGSIRINFYIIAVGPYHLDFEIKLNGKQRARASFDIKIAQVVSMKIQPQQIEMYDVKEFVGDKYAYSLKTIIGNTPISHQLSYVYEVKQSKEKEKTGIKWSKSVDALMPTINDEVPFYEFHYATLKFIFWRVDRASRQSKPTEVFGQCYISFVKMLSFDSLMIQKQNREFEIKKIQLTEKLWNHGVECGKIKVKLNFQVEKHLKQMLVCVRTEKGISKMSPVFKQNDMKGKSNCKEITEIINISERLTAAQIGLEKKKTTLSERKACFKEIGACLQQLHSILQVSSKETSRFYKYGNSSDLIKGQAIILDIGNRILGYMDEEYDIIENMKWKLLGLIVKRGQFSLNAIGFQNYDQLNSEELNKKISLALKFQEFLYKLLGLTFKILGLKRYDQERIFAQLYCAVAYFRIPQFRKRLIQLIKKPDDPEIEEWRGTDFSLSQNNENFKVYLPGENTFEILFDWEKYFYKYIETNPKYLLNLAHLEQLLKQEEWQARIQKRRGAFFAFIKQWVGYVENTSVRIVASNWKHFPGYIDILRGFLVEMKLKPVKLYPSSIKLACRSLLANQNLLNILITIIFMKTSINNSVDVLKILELINSFFDSLKERNKRIPSTFNYPFFYKGLKMIIESQYSFTIAKALYVIYEHFEFFNYEFKIDVCRYLLGKIFFNLFLHWSNNVRTVFHHLLVIKIYNFFSEDQKIKTNTASKRQIEEISNRYDKLLVVLENAKKIKEKEFVPTYEKDLYSKLRKGMRKKKKNGDKQKIEKKNFFNNQSDGFQQQKSEDLIQKNSEIKAINGQIDINRSPKLQTSSEPQRFDSQIITMDILQALEEKMKNPKKKQKDQVIRTTKPNNSSRKDSATYSDTQAYPCSNGEIFFRSLNSSEQTQMPIMNEQDYKYVVIGMKEFSITSRQYLKTLKQLKQAPKIKPILTLDSGEMRPDDYGEIQQW